MSRDRFPPSRLAVILLLFAVCLSTAGARVDASMQDALPVDATASPSFVEHIVATGFDTPEGVTAADLDRDGDMDLVAASYYGGTVAWWENNGSQAFTEHIIDEFFDHARQVFIADVDGDGRLDVLAASGGLNQIAWYRNRGDKTFEKRVVGALGDANSVSAADLDNDGDVDVVGAGGASGDLLWWEHDGAGNFTEHALSRTLNSATWVHTTDMDHDGDGDVLAVAAYGGENLWWWENLGNRTFIPNVLGDTPGAALAVSSADIDGDGYVDMLSGDGVEFAWWRNNGGGIFSRRQIYPRSGAAAIFPGDLDGDGDLDAVGSLVDGSIFWYENDGAGAFSTHNLAPGYTYGYPVDINGDGNTDVLATSFDSDLVAWFENTGVSDATPPGAVDDLAAVPGPGAAQVTLRWTAPGDDGRVGRARAYDVRYASAPIRDEAAWAAATGAPDEPVPGWAGTAQSLTVSGLTPGTVTFFALKTQDEVPNVSALSASPGAEAGGGEFGDTTPPAAITDLAASPGPNPGEVALAWTAPGDDGMTGQASAYEVRYANSPITQDTWPRATVAPDPPAPAAAGSAQQMTVGSLQAGVSYYFAVRAADEAPNWSAVSNSPSAVPTAAPDRTDPARVTDLRAESGAQPGTVWLYWTATGDDGMIGRANHYVMRYHTAAITKDNWNQAHEVSNEPDPGDPGQPQSMEVTGLPQATWLYFAVRARDEARNSSSPSNSPSAWAPAQAQASLPDLQITALDVQPGTVEAGQPIAVSWTEKNAGTYDAGIHATTVYLGPNCNSALGRRELCNRNLSLAAGAEKSDSCSSTVPADLAPGEYWVSAVADSVHTVLESNEGNNQRNVLIEVGKPPSEPPSLDFSIDDIEVSQGIQVFRPEDPNYTDPPYGSAPWCSGKLFCSPSDSEWPWEDSDTGPGRNEIRLVQGRNTIVRVYVATNSPGAVTTAHLHYTFNGVEGNAQPLNGPIVVGTPKPRLDAGRTFNFLIQGAAVRLPADQPSAVLSLSAEVDPDKLTDEKFEDNNTATRDVVLNGRSNLRDLRIGFVPITTIQDGKKTLTGTMSPAVLDSVNHVRAALPFDNVWPVFPSVAPLEFPFTTDQCAPGGKPEDSSLPVDLWWQINGNGGLQPEKLGVDVVVGVFNYAVRYTCPALHPGWTVDVANGHTVVLTDSPLPEYLTHELSHLIPGLRHPYGEKLQENEKKSPDNACLGVDEDTTWPYDALLVKDVGVAVWPFTFTYKIKPTGSLIGRDDLQDIMSYCDYVWMSPYSWEAWVGRGKTTSSTWPWSATADTLLVVSGRVYSPTLQAQLEPIWSEQEISEPPGGNGGFCVQGLGTDDSALGESCFDLSFSDPDTGAPLAVDTFLTALPFDPSIRRVRLTHEGATLAEVTASPAPPAVTLLHPNGGRLNYPTTVSWAGADPDGDPLTYQLLYSADDGATWLALTGDITDTAFLADPATLAGTEAGRFKVRVSDGFWNAEDTNDSPFRVAYKEPVPVINPAIEAAAFPLHTTVALDGSAIAPQGDRAAEMQYAWLSDRDGVLGTEPLIYRDDLAPGLHQVTLVVTDTLGQTGAETTYLEVLADADGDDMPDPWEAEMGLDPAAHDSLGDADGDGLLNIQEYSYGTDPLLPDTDYDGSDDLSEILAGTDPNSPDAPGRAVYLPLVLSNAGPPPVPCRELLANGGFETDAAWTIPGTAHAADFSTAQVHGGLRSLRAGVDSGPDVYSYSSGYQAVTIPPDTQNATLRFWWYPVSAEAPAGASAVEEPSRETLQALIDGTLPAGVLAGDRQYALLVDEDGVILSYLLWTVSNASSWQQLAFELPSYLAGQTVRVWFGVYNDGNGQSTTMYVDDAALAACVP